MVPDDRVPPQAPDIERVVIGSMMADPRYAAIAIDKIGQDYFYCTPNRLIFCAMKEMFSSGSEIDILLLSNYLLKKGELDAVGGDYYLGEIAQSIQTYKNIESYIEILKDKRDRREGIKIHSTAINALFSDEESTGSDICQRSVSGLLGLSSSSKSKIKRIGEMLPDVFQYIEDVSTGKRTPADVTTGYPSIDKNVFLKKGFLHILAGRPSMGKTAVSDCFVRNMAKAGNVVLKFNFESSHQNDTLRNLFSESNVNLHDFNNRILPKRDYQKLAYGAGPLSEINIFLDTFSGNTPSRMYSSCLQVINTAGKLDVVVVDHLQLVPPDNQVRGNRNLEVGAISRELMFLAEKFNVVVIALSQLSRPQKGVAVRPPTLSDLRESGEIEQNAEVVMFLHREEYYQLPKEVDDETRDKVHFIYAKQKNGPTGCVKMGFIKKWFLLTELTNETDRDYGEPSAFQNNSDF